MFPNPRFAALSCLVMAVSILAPATGQAQGSAAQRKPPCETPEHRQFDFWLGVWDVTSKAGNTGSNRITRAYGGCVLREEYETGRGYSGTSLSFYDAAAGRWHQTWIDNQGKPLWLTGGLVKGNMVMSSPDGTQRVTWSPGEDDTVRQHWESSGDGGKTWTTVFDGTYTKKAEKYVESE